IKNDGHYFCRAGGNRPDGLNEPVTFRLKDTTLMSLHNCSEVVLTCYLKMKIIRAALKMS
ncbi:hypothetical protein V5O77_11330, partial [Escherichia coli]|uniref:hypothetical protein n=1 Tax=Escherichia coli TaxID=562 RepID=UPI003FA3261A